MSRSSEIRSQRFKAQRARERALQEAAHRTEYEDEEDDEQGFYEGQDLASQVGLVSSGDQLDTENVVALNDHSDTFNMVPLLAQAIKSSLYFRTRCMKISQFNDLVDEIYLKVAHLDPYEFPPSASTGTGQRSASPAFCLLYRAFEIKLTKNQLQTILFHHDSPFIRCLGVLYLRYVGKFDQLLEWVERLIINDQETFSPDRDAPKYKRTVSEWVESVITTLRYKETLFPRIPVPIERAIQQDLVKLKESQEAKPSQVLSKGTLCKALYWEDGKWYDARVEEPGSKPNSYWVTFLPEEEYGNQEEVEIKDIRLDEEEGSSQDESLNKRVKISSGETIDEGQIPQPISVLETVSDRPRVKYDDV